jgi:outer membrane protein OmpA-like peptidoglycan-associated protein
MDKQAEELRDDLKNATVERVGEGILITFDSGLLFELNSFALQQATKNNLKSLGKTLTKYDDTDILIEGHTDDTGEASYNNSLSERRAKAVADHLVGQQVPASRMTTKGYGEGQPIQSNDTEVGRQANRRVEVAIYANKKMKRMAENGTLQ